MGKEEQKRWQRRREEFRKEVERVASSAEMKEYNEEVDKMISEVFDEISMIKKNGENSDIRMTVFILTLRECLTRLEGDHKQLVNRLFPKHYSYKTADNEK